MKARSPRRLMSCRSLRGLAVGTLLASAVITQGLAGGPSVAALPSDNGRVVFTENTDAGGFDIFSVRRDGTRGARLTFNENSNTPAYGPAGRRIAFTRCEGATCAVWLMRADGSRKRPLIPSSSRDPAWSPDGTQIVYVGVTEFGPQLFIYSLATGVIRQLTFGNAESGPRAVQPSWSPGGRRIAFIRFTEGGPDAHPGAVFVIRTAGTRLKQVTPVGRLTKVDPDWSPNGGRIAFARILPGGDRTPSEAKGISTIRPDGTDVMRLSSRSERGPSWAPSGKRLAFARVPSESPEFKDPGLWTMGRLGHRLRLVRPRFFIQDPDWQPRP